MPRDYAVIATEISRDVLSRYAADVDQRNRFPSESIEALQQAGLLGLMVPEAHGGCGGSIQNLWKVAAALGEECLSTALIWSMHSQQVAVLARYASESQRPFLERIAREALLVASVTSEYGKGADIWSSDAPLLPENGRIRLRRSAPVVSYGKEAGLYLIKMRLAEDVPPTEVALVLMSPQDGEVRVEGSWNAMGMRGTRSIPMRFDAIVDADRIVGNDFRKLALETMVPIGYVAWSASWFGAAKGVLNRFVKSLRSPKRRSGSNLNSDLLKNRLARLRLSLDLVESLLETISTNFDVTRGQCSLEPGRNNSRHFIRLNNLKVASSEMTFSVVSDLIEIAGMREGYMNDGELGLDRVFRDLRSATLMYHNDRLMQANGNLILMEQSPLAFQLAASKNRAGISESEVQAAASGKEEVPF